VLPLKVQVPVVIAYVTLPVPLPPVVLSAEVVVVVFKALGEDVTRKDACAIKAAALVTVVVYVLVVVPSCAVTTVVMVFAPTFKLILPLATPVATAVPLTVTVALAWLTVGVTVIDDTALATDCV
jgi:hypothetical protein